MRKQWFGAILLASSLTGCWDPASVEHEQVPAPAQTHTVNALEAPSTRADHHTSMASDSKGPAPDAKMRFVKVDAAAAARGKTSYAMCMGCHGAEAEGRVGTAPALASKSFLAAASDRFLFNTIKDGRPGTTMTPWGAALKENQIHDIIAFLRTQTPTQAKVLNESPLKGVPAKGQDGFTSICGRCHGRTGGGYMESGPGTGIGRKGFLDTVTNGFLRTMIKHGKSGTQMKGFDEKAPASVADLSDAEIEDIIAYMRKNAW